MNKIKLPPLGIIEGFFGRSWSWAERQAYAQFLALNEFNFYIYAPKNDFYLRKHWQEDWPLDIKKPLFDLRDTYRDAKIDFGVGLSPYEIYLDNSQHNRHNLRQRIAQLNTLSPDILCILFDDMRGDIPKLAEIQIELMHVVANTSTAKRIIFCPTYYSFDPVLEKVFGTMPDDYWHTLRSQLDSEIDVFWTGEKVCSTEYTREHLATVTELFGRKPFLWDNYPVNDGALKSNHLHVRSVNQTHGLIQQQVAGHAINPMNQAFLSQIAIASVQQAYAQANNYEPEKYLSQICTALCGETIADYLLNDIGLLQDLGLKKMTQDQKQYLFARYNAFPHNPFCAEIVAWLKGEYTFDPNCLTE